MEKLHVRGSFVREERVSGCSVQEGQSPIETTSYRLRILRTFRLFFFGEEVLRNEGACPGVKPRFSSSRLSRLVSLWPATLW